MSNYINIPAYKDASIQTLIKDIPAIINHNNSENDRLFKSLFNFFNNDLNIKNDLSTYNLSQYLIVPLITDGIVKGGTGEFNNIKFNYLEKQTALNSFIGENKAVIDHQYAINRFSNFVNDGYNKTYTHDAASIYYNNDLNSKLSVYDKLSNIDGVVENVKDDIISVKSEISDIKDNINLICDKLNINKNYNSISTFRMARTVSNDENSDDIYVNSELVDTYNSQTNSYTYPTKIYSYNQSEYKLKYKYDELDIKNNKKFRYYIVDSKYSKVNNQYICALHTNKIGNQTNLILDNITDNDLIIKLFYDGSQYHCIKVLNSDIDLCRLTLTCIDINEYGSKWYVTNYSGNIEFIKI